MEQPKALYVTYVEKEGPFLKVWGQTDKKSSLEVEQALLRATPQFDDGFHILKQSSVEVGVLCCARYNDDTYYRARITSVVLIADGLVEVNFLDYGNKDSVPVTNLRSLDCFNATFISLPPLSLPFILAEVVCFGGEWNDQIVEQISKEIRYIETYFIIVAHAVRYFFVKIIAGDIDLGIHLVSRGFMQRTSIQTQEAVLLAMMPRTPQQSPVNQALLTYKAYTLEPGSQHSVYVSYITDGPCHFSVQLKKYEDTLAQLMNEINSIPLKPLDELPLPGTVCLAKCLEDGNICRAVVTSEVDSQYKLFYVDFGNTEVVPLDNLYQITFKFVIPKVMAIRLSLDGIEKSTMTMQMLCAFKQFVDNRLLQMEVIPANTRLALPRCRLWDPDTNIDVKEVIIRAAVNAYPEPVTLNKGFTQMIRVSYVYSCNRFFVQLTSKSDDLTQLMFGLQSYCQSNKTTGLDSVKVGLPCSAMFSVDSQWYRSLILEVYENSAKIRYIDFGNEEVVAINSLKTIGGEHLTVLRPQAIECCLNGYQNLGEDVERDDSLEELVLEQEFTMKVVDMVNGKVLVDLVNEDNYNVGSLLLEKIAAAKSQVCPMLVQGGCKIEHRKNSLPKSDGPDRRPTRNSKWDEKSEENPSWRKNNGGFRKQDDVNANDPESGNSWRQDHKGFRNRKDDDWNNRPSNEPWKNDHDDRNDNTNENSIDNRWAQKKDYRPRQEQTTTVDRGWGDSNTKSNDADDGWGNKNDDSNKNRGHKFKDSRNNDSWKDNDGDKKWTNKGSRSYEQDKDRHNKGDWNSAGKSDGPRRKPNFRREGSELSSSGSERSFKKGPRTSSRNDSRPPRVEKKFSSFNSGGGDNSWNVSSVKETFNSAPNNAQYKHHEVTGQEAAVSICWFHNPTSFHCQLNDYQEPFKKLMEDIQFAYKSRKPGPSVKGAPVIGLFPEDNVLYRARVLEVEGNEYKVHYVDFGNVSKVKKVWPIETKFMEMPAQAISCGLKGIEPVTEDWPDPDSFSSYFEKSSFTCQFLTSSEGRYWVTLSSDNVDIGQQLVQDGLVKFSEPVLVDFELPLLVGQQFRAMVKQVNSLHDFTILLQSGTFLNCIMHNLNDATETFEDVLREQLEQIIIVYVDDLLNERLAVTLYDAAGNKFNIINPDGGAFDNVDPLCPYLVSRPTICGYVSYVNETTIVVQPSENTDNINYLLEQLFEQYDSVILENPIIPEEEFVYAVRSCDGNWYRARVTTFDDEKATVTYLDYGNSEDVLFSELRELTPEFLQWDAMALLVHVNVPTEDFLDQEVSVTIHIGEDGWNGDVHIPSPQPAAPENLDEHLEDGFTEIFADPAPAEEITEPERAQIEPEQVEPSQTNVPQIGIPVVLSHIDDPSQFYLQLVDSLAAIDELQLNLQEQVLEMVGLENPTVGGLCAAPYSVDQQWYRAQILDVDGGDITAVRFVDYGNTDVMSNNTTNIKTLPPALLSLEVYATRCTLKIKPTDEEWSTAAIERFEVLTGVEDVRVEFVDQDEKTHYVELYCNGENVKDCLIKEGFALLDKLDVETKLTAFVSHVNSPSEFWMQLENCIGELEWISEQLSSATDFAEVEDLTPGSLCAVMFPDDEMWYRARILSDTVAGIEVLFVDYGNSCVCSNLKQLPEDLVMLPPLAQKCSLQKPSGLLNWSAEAVEKFSDISAEGRTIFTVKKLSTGETSSVELQLDGDDVTLKLLPSTDNGYVTDFESLESFNIDKNGVLSDEKQKLEVPPGATFNEESHAKFHEINNEGRTEFQIESLPGNVVRLYLKGKDIRIDLPFDKVDATSTRSNTSHNEEQNEIESELLPEAIICGTSSFEEQHQSHTDDGDFEAVIEENSQLNHILKEESAVMSSEEVDQEDSAVDYVAADIAETGNANIVHVVAGEVPISETKEISSDEDINDTIKYVDEECDIHKLSHKAEEKHSRTEVNQEEQSDDDAKIVFENTKALLEDVVTSALGHANVEVSKEDSKIEIVNDDDRVLPGVPETGNALAKIPHDEKIVAESVSRPQTPVCDTSTEDEGNVSVASETDEEVAHTQLKETDALAKVPYDEKFFPASVSGSQTPVCDTSTEEDGTNVKIDHSQTAGTLPLAKIPHDEKVVPASISRPQTPFTDSSMGDGSDVFKDDLINDTNKMPVAKLTHDERLVPASIARPHTPPNSSTEDEGNVSGSASNDEIDTVPLTKTPDEKILTASISKPQTSEHDMDDEANVSGNGAGREEGIQSSPIITKIADDERIESAITSRPGTENSGASSRDKTKSDEDTMSDGEPKASAMKDCEIKDTEAQSVDGALKESEK